MNRTAIARVLLAALLLVVGCTRNAPPPAEIGVRPDSATPGSTPPPTGTDSILGRWTAATPDSVLVRAGACPFECCQYADWSIADSTAVYDAPRSTAGAAFMMPANVRFHADSGFVQITRIALVAVHDTVSLPPHLFLPGDTLVVLDYLGEGHYNVWAKGMVVESVEGFWGAEAEKPVAALIGNYEREWWVHITLPDGRKGWILVQPPMKLNGADACG